MVEIKFKNFFDRAHVVRAVKDGTKSTLAKAGAFVRRKAKGLIRPAPKSGKYKPQPGKTPRSHTGRLRDLIFFAWDAAAETGIAINRFPADNPWTLDEALAFVPPEPPPRARRAARRG